MAPILHFSLWKVLNAEQGLNLPLEMGKIAITGNEDFHTFIQVWDVMHTGVWYWHTHHSKSVSIVWSLLHMLESLEKNKTNILDDASCSLLEEPVERLIFGCNEYQEETFHCWSQVSVNWQKNRQMPSTFPTFLLTWNNTHNEPKWPQTSAFLSISVSAPLELCSGKVGGVRCGAATWHQFNWEKTA